MKKVVLSFATLALALAGHAQPTTAPSAQKTYPVASPNRTLSTALAAASKPAKPAPQPAAPAALVWVDATGKTLGRFANEGSMVASYNDQLAVIPGLTGLSCTGDVCVYEGGARWSSDFALYYESGNCSLTPYATNYTPATPYIGIPIKDAGITYLYYFRMADLAVRTMYSRFDGLQCSAIEGGFTSRLAPSVGVVPASTFGVEPFTVK